MQETRPKSCSKMRTPPCKMAWLLLALTTPLAQAQQWQVLHREEGCLPIAVLWQKDKSGTGTTPGTPFEYAELMRSRGYDPRIGSVNGFPDELREKVVQVRVREGQEPIFVRDEICQKLGKER